jgi:tetratricopeptide (TPR) repeat protein
MSESELEAIVAQAVAHHRAGRVETAEQMYREILAKAPDHPRVLHNLGMIHLQRQAFDLALPLLARAAAVNPGEPQMWVSCGHALISAGQFETADRLAADRLGAIPEGRAVVVRLRQVWGARLLEADRLAEAEAQYLALTDIAPADAEAHADLGYVRLRRGDNSGGLASLRQATTLDPANVRAWVNLSSAHLALGEAEATVFACRKALALEPGNGPAHQNLGVALATLGQRDAGLAALDQAVQDDPDPGQAQFRRSLVRLMGGDFAGGWRDYEARWRTETFLKSSVTVATPELQARLDLDCTVADLAGARVLLLSEQGVGDQIMFASMIPDLLRAAAEVTLACDPRLLGLFRESFPGLTVIDPRTTAVSLSQFDKVLAMGGLGRLFRNQAGDFPGEPYLRPGVEARARWRGRMGPKSGRLRVGLSWRGGIEATRIAHRSLALEQLSPILDLPQCEVVSLQYGDVAAEIGRFNLGRVRPLRMFAAEETDDFEDLAALVETLDIIVSVQTTLVHLTGALGKPGLAMLPTRPEWRYGVQGDSMPWYGSIRLLRQTTPGDWGEVLEEVVRRLQAVAEAG